MSDQGRRKFGDPQHRPKIAEWNLGLILGDHAVARMQHAFGGGKKVEIGEILRPYSDEEFGPARFCINQPRIWVILVKTRQDNAGDNCRAKAFSWDPDSRIFM
jgi:hypothetical protein